MPVAALPRPFASRDPGTFSFHEVCYAKADGIARITLNRPQAYNAYSTAALQELAAAFQDAAFDRPAVVALRVSQMPAGGVLAVEQRPKAAFIGSLEAHKRGGGESENEQ